MNSKGVKTVMFSIELIEDNPLVRRFCIQTREAKWEEEICLALRDRQVNAI